MVGGIWETLHKACYYIITKCLYIVKSASNNLRTWFIFLNLDALFITYRFTTINYQSQHILGNTLHFEISS